MLLIFLSLGVVETASYALGFGAALVLYALYRFGHVRAIYRTFISNPRWRKTLKVGDTCAVYNAVLGTWFEAEVVAIEGDRVGLRIGAATVWRDLTNVYPVRPQDRVTNG